MSRKRQTNVIVAVVVICALAAAVFAATMRSAAKASASEVEVFSGYPHLAQNAGQERIIDLPGTVRVRQCEP